MTCSRFHRLMEEWLDGELSGRARAGLERHLLDCVACARALEERRLLGQAVKKNLHESTAGLRFCPPAAEELLKWKGQSWRVPRFRFGPRGLLAVTAATLVVLLFIFHPWGGNRSGSELKRSPTAVITVRDNRNAGEESFISGRTDGFSYLIHMQVSAVETGDRS
ncbi:MAG: zf-HC2 domain-containing protein [Candidatus Aminicenantes bacterium]|nr:zf-HC2 domain-containing protein [Candidatus Aminicenantes bacterium]